LKTNSQILMS